LEAFLQHTAKTPIDPAALPNQVQMMDFDSGTFSANSLVDGVHGKALELTGDHGVNVPAGNFARWQPFSVAAWIQAPKAFERSVVFHRSRAWTDAASRGYELLIEDGHLSAALIHFWPGNAIRIRTVQPLPTKQWQHVVMTWDGSSSASGLHLWLNGQRVETQIVRDQLTRNITGGGGDNITIGERFRDSGFAGGLVDDFRVFDRQLTALEVQHLFDRKTLTDALAAVTNSEAVTRVSPELTEFAAAIADAEHIAKRQALQTAREALCKQQDALKEIMVMRERPQPRQTHVLHRGEYNAPAEKVSAAVPDWLLPMDSGTQRNRLGLATWLTSPEHPLTARVAVNRFWQMCFGQGLVRTPEDFGSQGSQPSHPKLLDWLAHDFKTHNWDVKRLLKQILMSATYQQSSSATAELRQRDPENLLLTRAPVYRLSAEMLRDNALAVSGLLGNKIGGPPAKPYELAAAFKPSKPDAGPGLYRRSLYTYWKRTSPAPMMMTLDAAKRDVCRVKRESTASPLQSLVVMNGPQFVEAARVLAQRLLDQHPQNEKNIITDMFRLLTSRQPSDEEAATLQQLYDQQLQHFQQNAQAAAQYLAVGESKTATENPAQLAALASVANALLAYDESLMKR
jgi:hypothetical protein